MSKKAMTIEDLAKTIEGLARSTAEGFADMNDRLSSKIESEVGSLRTELSSKIESEIGSARSEIKSLDRKVSLIQTDLAAVNKRTFEDDNTFAADIVELQEKDRYLEKEIKKLKIAKAC